jgi:hypothetical protein
VSVGVGVSTCASEFEVPWFELCPGDAIITENFLEAQNRLGCTAVFLIECRPTLQRRFILATVKTLNLT